VPDASYQDVPAGTRILGAVKLTGHLTPDWNFGTIQSVTDREMARLSNGDGHTWNSEVEPLTYYGVARAERSYDDRRFGLGFIGTVAARRFDDPALLTQLPAGLAARRHRRLGLSRSAAHLDPVGLEFGHLRPRAKRRRSSRSRPTRCTTSSAPTPDTSRSIPPPSRSPAGAAVTGSNKEKGAGQFNAAIGTPVARLRSQRSRLSGARRRRECARRHRGTSGRIPAGSAGSRA
jgi:hypothetical protein